MMRGGGERGEREETIRKGPWKAEEDEVLMNHVNKYGPRDWSSIRSKGLLQRTGKSCRLRWVNKLRPNLKNGCKFSLEEERVVIELQAQFGNKWARIATYLQGRTDNDVKNFWSSRQKRLARILQSPPPSKPQKRNNRQTPVFHHIPTFEAPKLNSAVDEESSSKASCSSSSSHIGNSEMIKMVPLPDLVNPLNYEANMCQLNFISTENNPCNEFQTQITFPRIPQSEPELPFSPESQALVARLEDPNFMDVFGPGDACGIGNGAQLPVGLARFELEEACRNGGNGAQLPVGQPSTRVSFFDDFPTDMFDHIEPLPSPSE